MTTINSNTSSIQTVPSTASTPIASASTAVTITAATAPTISTKNSSNVAISPPAIVKLAASTTPTTKPMTVADVIAANGVVPEGTVIKDTAANFNAAIKTLVGAKNVSSIAFTDAKPPTITVEKNFFKGDMTDATDEDLALVKKISSNYTLKITNVSAPMALVLKAPTKNATLSLSINDALVNLLPDFAAFQSLAKAKTISIINVDASPSGLPKSNFTITAAQLKSSPELLATIKGDYDLTITGVAAADAVTIAGNADKVLKASGSQSTQAKVAITDTSANLVKNIAALELAATAGRLTSITVSDGKALVLTEAQIKADSHFLATTFTSNATVEATAVAAADVLSVQSLVNANSKLTLTKESIADTAANIQANLDNLETAVKASSASSASNAFTIANIGITDKGSISVTNSTLVIDIDALKVLTGKYTLNVTDMSVSDALALKAPSKDSTLTISVKDTAVNIAANWDKLQTVAKAKTLTAITITDSASSLLSMTAAQLKADADALKLVAGYYKLAVTGVAAADVTKTLTTKNIYSVEIKDTAANILKNLTSIQTAVTAAKIQNVVITDAANPSLSISDIFALTTTLPNVTLASGVKFNVKDTASTIIAHARDDIGDVLKNAGTVAIIDKTTPNLTLADAITLKGINNLDKTTKYNVTDGGSVIATQAAIAGETILSGAASVTINKNFTIADAKAVTGIKTLAKGTVYSITDTADNILTQSAVSSDKILSGANTVTVVDTSANIVAKLDQLEVLAKAGKIADIKFTDTPTTALSITQDQLVKDAEAIGKIVSQRTLPVLSVTKPATPAPLFDNIYNFDLNNIDYPIMPNTPISISINNKNISFFTNAIIINSNDIDLLFNQLQQLIPVSFSNSKIFQTGTLDAAEIQSLNVNGDLLLGDRFSLKLLLNPNSSDVKTLMVGPLNFNPETTGNSNFIYPGSKEDHINSLIYFINNAIKYEIGNEYNYSNNLICKLAPGMTNELLFDYQSNGFVSLPISINQNNRGTNGNPNLNDINYTQRTISSTQTSIDQVGNSNLNEIQSLYLNNIDFTNLNLSLHVGDVYNVGIPKYDNTILCKNILIDKNGSNVGNNASISDLIISLNSDADFSKIGKFSYINNKIEFAYNSNGNISNKFYIEQNQIWVPANENNPIPYYNDNVITVKPDIDPISLYLDKNHHLIVQSTPTRSMFLFNLMINGKKILSF